MSNINKNNGFGLLSEEASSPTTSFDMWMKTDIAFRMLNVKGLSNREAEVMTWVARGKSNSEVGLILQISPRTVAKHLEHIFSKLDVGCRTSAVVKLFEIMHEKSCQPKEGLGSFEGTTPQNRILLVDDDSVNRSVIRSMLESNGYTCEEAEHGGAALTFLRTTQVDLVITDNRMPVLGGLRFLEHLSTITLDKIPSVIMYTGNVTEELKEQAFKAGVYDVLSRPSSMKKLLSSVTQAIQFGRTGTVNV